MRRQIALMGLLVIGLFLAGCPSEVTIGKILADPHHYQDKEIVVRANVVTGFGGLGRGIYEIEDGTGRIFVISERGIPGRGARVRVHGRVVNAFTFAGQNFATAIREIRHKAE
jgi:hypothetical protein